MGEKSGADEELGVTVDLLGLPLMPLKDPRGRPSFKKTKENQMLVMSLRSKGQTQDEIARFMGCDPKTLRKNFSRELDHGQALLEGIAMQALVRRALEGNVTAIKTLLDVTSVRAPNRRPAQPAADKPVTPVGKKEQLAQAARAPGPDWGQLIN